MNTMSTMAEELIVDFLTHRSRSMRSVHFTDTAKLHIVPRLNDNEHVHRRDLWYNGSDYSRMKLAKHQSALKVRAMASDGVLVSYSGDDGLSDDCLIGIEHLLTPAIACEVMACRRRCVRAVLQEQARQAMNSDIFGWNNNAMASIDETRRAAVRARQLGKLHRDKAYFLEGCNRIRIRIF